MSIDRTLARVDADLELGHTYVAIQRLSTLVQLHGTDLALRERLAAVHLSTGNLVEAGRWSYLSADRDPVATAAFERAFPDPIGRYDAVRFRGTPDDTTTGFARTTLVELTKARTGARPPQWRRGAPIEADEQEGCFWPALFVTAAVGALVALVTIGLVTVFSWL